MGWEVVNTEINRPFDLEEHDKAISDKWISKIKQSIRDIENIDLVVHDDTNHYYKSGEEIKTEVIEILKRIDDKNYRNHSNYESVSKLKL